MLKLESHCRILEELVGSRLVRWPGSSSSLSRSISHSIDHSIRVALLVLCRDMARGPRPFTRTIAGGGEAGGLRGDTVGLGVHAVQGRRGARGGREGQSLCGRAVLRGRQAVPRLRRPQGHRTGARLPPRLSLRRGQRRREDVLPAPRSSRGPLSTGLRRPGQRRHLKGRAPRTPLAPDGGRLPRRRQRPRESQPLGSPHRRLRRGLRGRVRRGDGARRPPAVRPDQGRERAAVPLQRSDEAAPRGVDEFFAAGGGRRLSVLRPLPGPRRHGRKAPQGPRPRRRQCRPPKEGNQSVVLRPPHFLKLTS
mmetsp:Transcript_35909/g.115066  ORF Transcript_35909/g.115066 Transcript_35909/m.115066 type:complete len:308 (-) Transcript_35909:463-1386(-)